MPRDTRRDASRLKTVTCKYLNLDSTDARGEVVRWNLPLVQVLLVSQIHEEFRTIGLVDSGSTSTLIPKEIADVLLLSCDDKNVEVTGAGGVFNCNPVTLWKLSVLKNDTPFSSWWNKPVLVPDEDDVLPYVILGRDYVFKRFDIQFSDKRRKMIFTKRK